jgi:hypothetical protein
LRLYSAITNSGTGDATNGIDFDQCLKVVSR